MVTVYVLGVILFGFLIWLMVYLLSNQIPRKSRKDLLQKMYDEGDIDQETYIKYGKDL